jgi:O-antigen/teichoic acid export membrane protein
MRSQQRLFDATVVGALQSVGAQAIGLLMVTVSSSTPTSYMAGAAIGQGAAALVGLARLRPAPVGLTAIREQFAALRFGLPMIPQQLSGYILAAGDRVVVKHDLGSVATGRYSVAYNIGSIGVILLVFVNQAWIPRIYAVRGPLTRARLIGGSRDIMNLLMAPVVVGIAAGSPFIVRLWAPPSFRPNDLTLVVAVVALSTFAYGYFLANLRALMSEGETGRAAMMTLLAAVVNIGLNLALVPPLHLLGSAIATVLSYALLARLTWQPRGSALYVSGAPRRLLLILVAAGVVTPLLAVAPAGGFWMLGRVTICLLAVALFVALLRWAVNGKLARLASSDAPEGSPPASAAAPPPRAP